MYPPGFDRADEDSPFLSFVADEFGQRGTARRGELAQKVNSHPFVDALGMRVPKRLAVLDRIEELHDAALPDKCVLKVANGWSSRGVQLLERTGPDEYFDHMTQQTLTTASIVEIQTAAAQSFSSKEPCWIVEELIEPLMGLGAIPFDYKFYCFQGTVGLIVQIDRNSGPVKIALFDGEFRPLKRGTDYLLSDRVRHGAPVIPLHAPELLWWARRLSLEADSPFVSVDMLDSPTGPVFGEFTYSPGGTHKRMFVFSHRLLDQFDELISATADHPDLRAQASLEDLKSMVHPGPVQFKAWAGFAYSGGPKGADRLHVFYKKLAVESEPGTLSAEWYGRLSVLWAGIRNRLRPPNRKIVAAGAGA
ncbi:ATP-grasp fold amidoligase family protein [Arthrobacter sp. NPDC058130]|uniref:ATP-grasp fold amidoligase family protein n=1 Tax=Arthrobacter sp. NPDC058130 TaxID=3346353 RepID=UPI0036E3135C